MPASRRAASPVLASLLMIAVALSLAILAYVWTIGLTGTLMGGGGSQVKEQLILEAYSWPNGGSLVLNARNVGSSSLNITNTYVNGFKQTVTWTPGTVVNPGGSAQGTIETFSGFTPVAGVAYTIKIVSQTGGVFAFTAIYGSSG